MKTIRKSFHACASERGYALPSMLVLVTILSLVAASVISLQYLQKQQVLMEVAKVKAEYAAESGIATTLSRCRSAADVSLFLSGKKQYDAYGDGSESRVEVEPWGLFLLVKSEGSFRTAKAVRTALVADRPSKLFENALVFANLSHQLILTGTSHIKGDIVIGPQGVTTGSMRDRQTPARMPVEGRIRKEADLSLPNPQATQLFEIMKRYRDLFPGDFGGTEPHALSGEIPDSVQHITLSGDVSVDAHLTRRNSPLYVAIQGRATVRPKAALQGLIAIVASKGITISGGAVVENAIFVSGTSIDIQRSARVRGQFIAPSIVVYDGAQALYPSLVISALTARFSTAVQSISVEDGARVEGFVALLSTGNSEQTDSVVVIKPSATVIGALHSDNRITLDGTVIGTVTTRDFYFYEAPTTYYGWLRSGRIDRTKLPSGFLLPPGFSDEMKLKVLDWI